MNEPTTTPDISFGGWRKSTYSQPSESDCVEVGFAPGHVGVRDTKKRSAGRIAFGAAAWSGFIAELGEGRYSHPTS